MSNRNSKYLLKVTSKVFLVLLVILLVTLLIPKLSGLWLFLLFLIDGLNNFLLSLTFLQWVQFSTVFFGTVAILWELVNYVTKVQIKESGMSRKQRVEFKKAHKFIRKATTSDRAIIDSVYTKKEPTGLQTYISNNLTDLIFGRLNQKVSSSNVKASEFKRITSKKLIEDLDFMSLLGKMIDMDNSTEKSISTYTILRGMPESVTTANFELYADAYEVLEQFDLLLKLKAEDIDKSFGVMNDIVTRFDIKI